MTRKYAPPGSAGNLAAEGMSADKGGTRGRGRVDCGSSLYRVLAPPMRCLTRSSKLCRHPPPPELLRVHSRFPSPLSPPTTTMALADVMRQRPHLLTLLPVLAPSFPCGTSPLRSEHKTVIPSRIAGEPPSSPPAPPTTSTPIPYIHPKDPCIAPSCGKSKTSRHVGLVLHVGVGHAVG